MKTLGIIARHLDSPAPFGTLTYYLEDMIRMKGDLKVSIAVFSPLDWDPQRSLIRSHTFDGNQWHEHEIAIPQLLYTRFTPRSSAEWDQYNDMVNTLERQGYHFCVPLALEALLRDKQQFQHFLETHQLPAIPLIDYRPGETEEVLKAVQQFQTLYIKPRAGSGGKGISLLSLAEAHVLIKTEEIHYEVSPGELANFLSQHFPPDQYLLQPKARTRHYHDACYDIRAMIQNDGRDAYEVSAISVRVGQAGHWVSNLNSGGDGLAIEALELHFQEHFGKTAAEIAEEVTVLSRRCADLLSKQYGDFAEIALDMLYTEDLGAIILEGNSKPSRWVFNRIAGQYPVGSQLHERYKSLRKKTVVYPLRYAVNKVF